MIPWELLGPVLQISAIIFAAGGVVISVRNLDRRMVALENAMKQIVTIMVTQGRHEERMNAMDQRILAQGQRLDEHIRNQNDSLHNMGRMVEATVSRVNRLADGNFRQDDE